MSFGAHYLEKNLTYVIKILSTKSEKCHHRRPYLVKFIPHVNVTEVVLLP